MQARVFELTDSLQAALEALAVKDAAHAVQLSALRTENDAALAAQASAFDKEKAALQSELEALKASARAGSVDIGGDQDQTPSAAPRDIELAIVGEDEGRQSQQQRLGVSATEEEAVFSSPWSTVRARKTWKGALLLGTVGGVVLGTVMGQNVSPVVQYGPLYRDCGGKAGQNSDPRRPVQFLVYSVLLLNYFWRLIFTCIPIL
jgi:hypothetical protein